MSEMDSSSTPSGAGSANAQRSSWSASSLLELGDGDLLQHLKIQRRTPPVRVVALIILSVLGTAGVLFAVLSSFAQASVGARLGVGAEGVVAVASDEPGFASGVRVQTGAGSAGESQQGVSVSFESSDMHNSNGNSAVDIGVDFGDGPPTAAGPHSQSSPRRGMVIAAGGPFINRAIALVLTLRMKIGTKLPIQIVFTGADEMPRAARKLLRGVADVELVNLAYRLKVPANQLQGFQIKPLAVIESEFDEVLLADADDMFFVDPEILFSEPLYKETGTLFFRDFLMRPYFGNPSAFLPSFFEDYSLGKWTPSAGFGDFSIITGESQHEQDSSVVLWDKKRLQAATGILRDLATTIREEAYKHIHGDKEMFWMACELAGSDYAFTPFAPSMYGQPNGDGSETCIMNAEWSHAQFVPSTGALAYINAKKLVPEYSVSKAMTERLEKGGCKPGAVPLDDEGKALVNARNRALELSRDLVGLQNGEPS